jgi:hypothetical protein
MPEKALGLADRIAGASAGLRPLLRDAEATWRSRATNGQVEDGTVDQSTEPAASGVTIIASPGWRSFEDAFPTFYQFTNRPR